MSSSSSLPLSLRQLSDGVRLDEEKELFPGGTFGGKRARRDDDDDEEEEEDDDDGTVDVEEGLLTPSGHLSAGAELNAKSFFTDGSKIIFDPIHGHMRIDSYLLEFIDTAEFQRLRELKQLGTTSMVFPGGSHNRFQHCLGVSHLAGMWLEHLNREQPELKITEADLRYIKIAGLCHDLGHGPFSHAFEGWAKRHRPDFHHEDMSLALLRQLVKNNGLTYSSREIRFISQLIRGFDPDARSGQRALTRKLFLYDIVANKRNGVDVDKFDYLARDSYNLGIKSTYDFSRLIKFSRVIDNRICFYAKEAYCLYEMYHARYTLFKQVYTHKVGIALELMINDAFSLADPLLRISAALDDPDLYAQLDDTVLRRIEWSTEPQLAAARALVARIRRRDLYALAGEASVPGWNVDVEQITVADVCQHCPDGIAADKLRVRIKRIGTKGNPVDNVRFFRRYELTESFALPKSEVSRNIPENFAETSIQVFCTDKAIKVQVCEAFKAFLRSDPRIAKANALHLRAHEPLTPPTRPSQSEPSTPQSSRVLYTIVSPRKDSPVKRMRS